MILNKRELTLGHSYLYTRGKESGFIEFAIGDYTKHQNNPERFSGIPLTPEILTENLGFQSDCLTDEDRTPILILLAGDFLLVFDMQMNLVIDDSNEVLEHVESVHDIQNVYYTLADEELEFKTTEG